MSEHGTAADGMKTNQKTIAPQIVVLKKRPQSEATILISDFD
jgi:hypothetical protein